MSKGKKRKKSRVRSKQNVEKERKKKKFSDFWTKWIAGGLAIVVTIICGFVTIYEYAFSRKPEEDISPIVSVIPDNYIRRIPIYHEAPPDLSLANAYYSQGQEFFHLGEYEIALLRYEEALEEFKQISHADVDMARIQCAIGLVYKRLGNLDAAVEWYTTAIGTLDSLPEDDDVSSAQGFAFYLRGFAYLEKRDLESAKLDADRCLEITEVTSGECTYASALCLLGEIYSASYYGTHSPFPVHGGTDLGVTWDDAMSCFDRALESNGAWLYFCPKYRLPKEKIVVNSFLLSDLNAYWYIIDDPDAETAAILNCRATLMLMLDTTFLEEAKMNSEAALQIYNSLPADQREGIQDTYFNLFAIVALEGYAEPEGVVDEETLELQYELMKKALEYSKKWCGESKRTAVAYENMGFVCMLMLDYDSAVENYQEAKRIFSELGLAEDAQKQDKYIEAVEQIRGSDEKWRIVYGDPLDLMETSQME